MDMVFFFFFNFFDMESFVKISPQELAKIVKFVTTKKKKKKKNTLPNIFVQKMTKFVGKKTAHKH